MRHIFLGLITTTIAFVGSTSVRENSADVHLFLLTTSPGKSIDQSWGHSALWFNDTINQVDEVFEYTSTESKSWVSNLKMLMGTDRYRLRLTNINQYASELEDPAQTIRKDLVSSDSAIVEQIHQSLISELNTGSVHTYSLSRTNCSTLLFDHITAGGLSKNLQQKESFRKVFRRDGDLNLLEEFLIIDLLPSHHAERINHLKPITPASLSSLLTGNSTKKNPTDSKWLQLIAILAGLWILRIWLPRVYARGILLSTGLVGVILVNALP